MDRGAEIRLPMMAVLLTSVWTWPSTALSVPLDKDGGPKLSAKAVLVLHNKTGKVLLARRATEVRSIASLTKLQAALVFIGRGLKLDKGTVINRDDWKVALQGCRTRLELKWTYSNRDLLHAALMSSDNRAISALGRAVGLHANALVQAMNEKARKMGLRKTRFRGPVGIDPGNQSTAWEIARIVRAASKERSLSQVMGKKEHWVKPMKGYLKHFYRNTNPLVGARKDVVFLASKTGYNSKAGYCVASVAKASGVGTITIVLLGCKRKADRPRDTKRIIRWLRSGGQQKST
jgi:D-alanyl-D-alanine endopeptidase (penicillin-binding protein 7)